MKKSLLLLSVLVLALSPAFSEDAKSPGVLAPAETVKKVKEIVLPVRSFVVDMNKLTQETQKMAKASGELSLVWWIPIDFWVESFSQNPAMSRDQIKEVIKALDPYVLLLVVEGKTGPFGGVEYRTKSQIDENIKIKLSDGELISPLKEKEVAEDVKSFLSMMKPAIANMLGPMGENMHFMIFPSESKKGVRYADANVEGSFTVSLFNKDFVWKLPLVSLMPPKKCPVCGEELNGNYKFCPYDGTKLK